MSTENFVTYWLARADLPYFLEPHEFYVSGGIKASLSSEILIKKQNSEKSNF
jgi:hypothetical protein